MNMPPSSYHADLSGGLLLDSVVGTGVFNFNVTMVSSSVHGPSIL
jgi:hypothetical protein